MDPQPGRRRRQGVAGCLAQPRADSTAAFIRPITSA